jgi:hypothetical protein
MGDWESRVQAAELGRQNAQNQFDELTRVTERHIRRLQAERDELRLQNDELLADRSNKLSDIETVRRSADRNRIEAVQARDQCGQLRMELEKLSNVVKLERNDAKASKRTVPDTTEIVTDLRSRLRDAITELATLKAEQKAWHAKEHEAALALRRQGAATARVAAEGDAQRVALEAADRESASLRQQLSEMEAHQRELQQRINAMQEDSRRAQHSAQLKQREASDAAAAQKSQLSQITRALEAANLELDACQQAKAHVQKDYAMLKRSYDVLKQKLMRIKESVGETAQALEQAILASIYIHTCT